MWVPLWTDSTARRIGNPKAYHLARRVAPKSLILRAAAVSSRALKNSDTFYRNFESNELRKDIDGRVKPA
jgi:hypothetical protein